MQADRFLDILDSDFYAGVPDSLLRPLCDLLMERYGTDPLHHMIAANEGNAAALAAGYHLATGKTGVVYMQNSGEGNIINPVASLLDEHVYGIPVIFVIGWRGQPGVHDEPQHVFQGMVTTKLLDVMNIDSFVVGKETSEDEVQRAMDGFRDVLAGGRSVAFVIEKGALVNDKKLKYENQYSLKREEIIEQIAAVSGDDLIVSTTGKASRELFEIRERHSQDHSRDFLTVGSMGHSSSIALQIALQRPENRVWCIDGDGAFLMHMGAAAVAGSIRPSNLIHVMINNGCHETVGGLPTVAGKMDVAAIAGQMGYESIYSVSDMPSLKSALSNAVSERKFTFIEVKCAVGARDDLGRPTTTAKENKEAFMARIMR